MTKALRKVVVATAAALACALLAFPIRAAGKPNVGDFLGTWRGSSVCADRAIAPACRDEVVVYEVRRAEKPGVAVVKADKIVDGQRVSMGDIEFAYDNALACWKAELKMPGFSGTWCLTVEGAKMKGTLCRIPGDEIVRKVELVRER